MKKYINTKTGKEVKVGDHFEYEKVNEHGKLFFECIITSEDLIDLKGLGWIEEVIVDDNQKVTDYYLDKIAKRKGWSLQQTKEYFIELLSIYPKAFKDCLYRVISIEWKDCNLSKLKNVFSIGTITSNEDRAIEVSTNSIVKWQNGAFFKTKTQAELAINIVDEIIKALNEK